MSLSKIIVVGGGAAGLELATNLGKNLGEEYAHITLVDRDLVNVWKPLWHEVASGTLIGDYAQTDYILQGYKNKFDFHVGSLHSIDRVNKTITLANNNISLDENSSLSPRILAYDYLILAIGSVHNNFNIEGVEEHCYFFDSYQECTTFRKSLIKLFLRIHEGLIEPINVAIVGGGATGVELAAELYYAFNQQLKYSHKPPRLNTLFNIAIIEHADRLLSAMPPDISAKISEKLTKLGIKLYLGEQVSKITQDSVVTKSGLYISANLKVWAAGIKGDDILTKLDLDIDRSNRIYVTSTLQSTSDNSIFALGDCAWCPTYPDSKSPVPATAQVAHQQASLLAKSLKQHILRAKPLLNYIYKERGSIVSVRKNHTIGYIKGGRFFDRFTITGPFAGGAYRFLYRSHQAALYGWSSTILLIIAEALTKKVRPRLKLH